MFPDPTLTLAGQLFWIVDVFMKTLAAEGCKRRIGLFSLAIWRRVKVFERRFSALYAQWKAGTLPASRLRRDSSPRPSPQSGQSGEQACGTDSANAGGAGAGAAAAFDPAACDAASMERARTRPASVLPRAFAWLPRMLPLSGGTLLGGVESLLLNFPEMQAFVTEVPQVGRLLRPICTMAGMKPPEWLALPKHKRVRKKAPSLLSEKDEAELRRITALFPDIPAGRAAKRVWRRMFEGKPVDLTKLSAVALGLVLHAPRDGNCPPPEIGYGGRSFPRLPKGYVPPKDWE